MHAERVTNSNSAWTGTVLADDTALAVTDTGGPGQCVLYLNGQLPQDQRRATAFSRCSV
ncbi:hypothetical protein Psi01_83760 [Planobispora siamensis]|uniref:Uncharacterized protein n=1 Tax=Planobispora siamensis TaxID=936338 RepID=A0A8J3SRW5_9ACTN|nr:hypothetical protein Psi01_83760 [Planobispora siamensis]